MNTTNLSITTPYNEVLTLAASAIHQQDFSFELDPSGDLMGMTIYDDMGDATQIEMDCIMFLEVYTLAVKAGELSEDQRAIIDPIMSQLN